ncbi:asparaginase [Rhizohabitans arisaemae]|uniref:asparaginase n=1 Tax=Rhizohabitans arisaemae TaxID=2720610 RepID=UPI0024B24D69|nr:asparaginase [Rhizohabitans arisaemae]
MIVEVIRSGFVESVHHARMIGFDAAGTVALLRGDAERLVSPRSAMKPLQAVAMVRHGLGLRGELLALAAASHSGEPFHVTGVRRILAEAGLDDGMLRCPPALPFDPEAADDVIRGGGAASPVYMNCSGKHAAMLATCVRNDWSPEGYLAPTHPLQRAIRATVEEYTGELVAATGVDGCGAPLFFVSLAGVARAYRMLVRLGEGEVADAMRAHPEWTSGTERDENRLMRAVPGLLVKSGAEGVVAFAHDDGRCGVVKVEDGAKRAQTPFSVAALRELGFTVPDLHPNEIRVRPEAAPAG